MSASTATPRLPAMVAVQAVLLRPADRGGHSVRRPGPWPVLAIVLDERNVPDDLPARVLSELLDQASHQAQVIVVDGGCGWTVLDADRALLRFSLRAHTPRRLDLDILLPAAPLGELLDLLRGGVTVGITTRRHAWALEGEIDTRTALHHLMLVRCPPSLELTTGFPAHRAHTGGR